MSFDTKYRPKKFKDVIGQKSTVEVLKKLVQNKQVFSKSYIFAGPSGTGKTTTARILARAMLCKDVDREGEPCNQCETCLEILNGTTSFSFVEMDAANHSGVDTIRQIVEELNYYTLSGSDRKIYLIDECFTEDTELMTEEGLQSIKTLVEEKYSGKVLSFDPDTRENVWRSVTDWFDIPDERETLKLYFDNSVELVVTVNQEIYTLNRGWVKACELKEEDEICETSFSNENLPTIYDMARLVKVEPFGKQKVYDVTVEGTHSFFASSRLGKQTHAILAHNCHRLSRDSMDALLKPMEDTLPNGDKRLVCLFCTTEPEKMRDTIKARCITFGIKEPEKEEAVERLRYISEAEGIPYEEEALDMIFQHGKGHVRDMVNALERVSRVGDLTLSNVKDQLGLGAVSNYYDILIHLKTDLPKSLQILRETLGMVDANTLYQGLASAALAAYRVHLGVLEGVGYTDQQKAQDLYSKVQEHLLWISDRILSTTKRVDNDVLVCEVILMHRYLVTGDVHRPPVFVPMQVMESATTLQESSEPVKQKHEEILGSSMTPEERAALAALDGHSDIYRAAVNKQVTPIVKEDEDDDDFPYTKEELKLEEAPSIEELVNKYSDL